MKKLMTHIGSEIEFNDYTLKINNDKINDFTAPYEHVKKMRASVYVLGPLLAKYGEAKVSMPGGCAWGPRPINLHLEAMKKLGRKDWGVGPDVKVEMRSDELKKKFDVQRDNDVLVKANHDNGTAPLKKHTAKETLAADPQLAVGVLIVKTKLIEKAEELKLKT